MLDRLRHGLARRWRRPVRRRMVEPDETVYGGAYFGEGRDPLDRMGLSGYERYDRDTSNANVAAFVLWKFFPLSSTLDVGCASGFVVEALRELGIDAQGVDVSPYAVEHAAHGARGHTYYANILRGLPYRSRAFDVVTALETLEHLPPNDIATALQELHRVTKRYLVCTIPSFGPNPNGPGGWFGSKVRMELLDQYNALSESYEGPIPYDDLLRDTKGEPIEGHLTIASFSWWTKRFEAAGFVRCGAVERRIHPDLARFGLTKYWNLYVLRRANAPEPPYPIRGDRDVAARARLWKLDERVPLPEDIDAVRATLGPDAV